MRLLVTGGAGYVGSITIEALLAGGHDVVVLDDLRTGHRAAVHPAAAFVEGDIADAPAVTTLLRERRIEAILHFAAASLVGESMLDPHRYFAANTVASLALLRAAGEAGVDRIVFSSTAALYGTPERTPIGESEPIRPESVYGETKWQIERAMAWLARTASLASVSLRYFNAAGASEERGEDHRPESHLIPIVLQVALGQRDAVHVFGDDYPTRDGTAVRDYIHVQDLADAHVLALAALEPGTAKAYNLGNGQGATVAEVLEAARAVTGHPIPAEVAPRRAGDPPALVADATLVRNELGWSPSRGSLTGIIESAWRWHSAHPRGYRG
jgi:UDP-glucose 4-epimerase